MLLLWNWDGIKYIFEKINYLWGDQISNIVILHPKFIHEKLIYHCKFRIDKRYV